MIGDIGRLQLALNRMRAKHRRFADATAVIIRELHAENRVLRARLEEYETEQEDADG